MQFSPLVIIAFLSANVYAGCYSGGTEGNATVVNGIVPLVCANLIGSYLNHERRYTCAMDSSGTQWNFQLQVYIIYSLDVPLKAN
jgi:hypothetical protein